MNLMIIISAAIDPNGHVSDVNDAKVHFSGGHLTLLIVDTFLRPQRMFNYLVSQTPELIIPRYVFHVNFLMYNRVYEELISHTQRSINDKHSRYNIRNGPNRLLDCLKFLFFPALSSCTN